MTKTIKKSKKLSKKKNLKNKTIHQIYGIFDDGILLKDIPVFYENVQKTKSFCKKHKYKYKMWGLKECTKLVKKDFPEYLKIWNSFSLPIQILLDI